jgi:hypothetical protein
MSKTPDSTLFQRLTESRCPTGPPPPPLPLVVLNHPYDHIGRVNWANINKWEELDFVKALPDETKIVLRGLPAEAEVHYEFCHLNRCMMPRLDPQRSRSYWLKLYNEQYQGQRDKNAHLSVIAAQAAFFKSVEQSLAHISSILERMNQTMLRVGEDMTQLYCDFVEKSADQTHPGSTGPYGL